MTRERVRALKLIAVLIPLLGATWVYGPAETPWSCDEQVKMAQDLSQNPVLAAINVDYLKVETYRSYPCNEGSEGDSIGAGKLFTTSTTLTMERLQAISDQAIRAQDWVKVATLGSTDPGSGGDSTICYHAKRSDQIFTCRLLPVRRTSPVSPPMSSPVRHNQSYSWIWPELVRMRHFAATNAVCRFAALVLHLATGPTWTLFGRNGGAELRDSSAVTWAHCMMVFVVLILAVFLPPASSPYIVRAERSTSNSLPRPANSATVPPLCKRNQKPHLFPNLKLSLPCPTSYSPNSPTGCCPVRSANDDGLGVRAATPSPSRPAPPTNR